MPTYKASEPTSRPDCVPAGEYNVGIVAAEEAVSKNGNEMFELKLRVEPSGAILFDRLVFTPASYFWIDAFRAATGEKVVPEEEVNLECDDLVGRIGRARLIVKEHEGRRRNEVAAWLPPQPNQQKSGDNPF